MGEVIEFNPERERLRKKIRAAAENVGLDLDRKSHLEEDIIIEGITGKWDKKIILDHLGNITDPNYRDKLEQVIDAVLEEE